MTDVAQLLISGAAIGCIYALIALGFVLIYKATEVVNFAQGDVMMLGAFVAFTFSSLMGLGFWLSLPLSLIVMALLEPCSIVYCCGPSLACQLSRL